MIHGLPATPKSWGGDQASRRFVASFSRSESVPPPLTAGHKTILSDVCASALMWCGSGATRLTPRLHQEGKKEMPRSSRGCPRWLPSRPSCGVLPAALHDRKTGSYLSCPSVLVTEALMPLANDRTDQRLRIVVGHHRCADLLVVVVRIERTGCCGGSDWAKEQASPQRTEMIRRPLGPLGTRLVWVILEDGPAPSGLTPLSFFRSDEAWALRVLVDIAQVLLIRNEGRGGTMKVTRIHVRLHAWASRASLPRSTRVAVSSRTRPRGDRAPLIQVAATVAPFRPVVVPAHRRSRQTLRGI